MVEHVTPAPRKLEKIEDMPSSKLVLPAACEPYQIIARGSKTPPQMENFHPLAGRPPTLIHPLCRTPSAGTQKLGPP